VQSVTIVTAAGFNLLVAQSSKPAAKALHEWMVGEVLPSVGKSGCVHEFWPTCADEFWPTLRGSIC
jgi:prophage antirepressor-like protein